MITHDFGHYFWGIDKAYKVPFYFRTSVHENEHPFRVSNAHVVNLSFGKALIVGRWCPGNPVIEKHLLEALRGKNIPLISKTA